MPLPAILGLSKAAGWILDPKNRTFLLIIVFAILLVIIGILFMRVGNLKSEVAYQKSEVVRVENNYIAANDSIRTYQNANGDMISEITGYKVTQKELETKYASLFEDYTFEKDKPDKTIIKTVIEYRDSIVKVPVFVMKDSLNNEYIYFKNDTSFDENNSRMITGKIPIDKIYLKIIGNDTILLDTTEAWAKSLYARILPGYGTFTLKQNMSLMTGLKYDKETKMPVIWVTSGYPGATITEITGAEVFNDKDSKAAFKKAQKSWGLGLHLGVGYQISTAGIHPGVYMGVGINWTPPLVRW